MFSFADGNWRSRDTRNMLSRGIGHPRGHKIRFTQTGQNPFRFERSRSTLTSLPFSRETSFEIERPQSNGASRLVINIATSYIKRDQRGRGDRSSLRYLPSLPNISSPRSTQRTGNTQVTRYHKIASGNMQPVPGTFRKAKYEPLPSVSPVHMSEEKQSRIADWVRDTNSALLRNYEPEPVFQSLPIINEQ